jgi:hypothetical protein
MGTAQLRKQAPHAVRAGAYLGNRLPQGGLVHLQLVGPVPNLMLAPEINPIALESAAFSSVICH